MNDRTMVKVECRGEILFIRTVSWGRKSPSRFALLRREFQQLEQRPESHLVCSDCGSFASLRLAKGTDGVQMLEIQFTWLQEEGSGSVRGWQESVRLPYGPFHAFAQAGENANDAKWRQLSIPEKVTRRYEFHSRKNLHQVVQMPRLRHKLGKTLEHHFQWLDAEKICIYDDGAPYSFFFEEVTSWARESAAVSHCMAPRIWQRPSTAYIPKLRADFV